MGHTTTKFANTTLTAIGTAIGERAIECEVCEDVGTTAGNVQTH